MATPTFPLGVVLWWALANPSCELNAKLQKYYRGTPKFRVALLAQSNPHFSYGCDFMMALGKHKLCTKSEVATVSRCRNIKGEDPDFGELP